MVSHHGVPKIEAVRLQLTLPQHLRHHASYNAQKTLRPAHTATALVLARLLPPKTPRQSSSVRNSIGKRARGYLDSQTKLAPTTLPPRAPQSNTFDRSTIGNAIARSSQFDRLMEIRNLVRFYPSCNRCGTCRPSSNLICTTKPEPPYATS